MRTMKSLVSKGPLPSHRFLREKKKRIGQERRGCFDTSQPWYDIREKRLLRSHVGWRDAPHQLYRDQLDQHRGGNDSKYPSRMSFALAVRSSFLPSCRTFQNIALHRAVPPPRGTCMICFGPEHFVLNFRHRRHFYPRRLPQGYWPEI